MTRLRIPAVLVALLGLAACTERTLRIASTPPGAEVILDRRSVGRTPVEIPFTHGGVHEIVLLGPVSPDDPSAPSVKPVTLAYDSTRFAYDTPFIDLFVDLPFIRAQDVHDLVVELPASDLADRYAADPKAFRAELRARAGILRERAREAQWSAPPRPRRKAAPRAVRHAERRNTPRKRPFGKIPHGSR